MTKILLVEDERSIAETIQTYLELHKFKVSWCSLGNAALAEIQKQNFDLIILDVGLPDLSGFSVCKELRSFCQTPVLFLTARASESDRIVAFEFGADDFLAKPFSQHELFLRIQAILRRSQVKVEGPLTHRGLELDSEKLKCLCQGDEVPLSRYEFKILEIMMKNPGRVYTREKLMDLVWEDPSMSLDRTVDSHIKTLRAKLKKAGAADTLIVTHRGTGYSLLE